MRLRWQPAVRVAPAYYDDPAYIDALAASVRQHLATLDFEPEALIASFHGMPRKYLEAGDPYHCQCQKTARLVREKLQWPAERWHTTFQSRFGSDPWLQPYTIDIIEKLARSGTRRLAVFAPGFAADCLETLEELGLENRAMFLSSGGEKFALVPCLNDSALGVSVIEAVVRRELMGWL
jgi:ferrochelatase